jgi:Peptidase family U32
VIVDQILGRLGLGDEVLPAPSASRFGDGADFRIEIPSVESPRVLQAVLDEASQRGVVVNRVSQGSGAMTLARAELVEMAQIGAAAGVEVCLFAGPREEWGTSASVRVGDGSGLVGGVRGLRQLRYAVDDVARACEAGIRSVLVADLGLLVALVAAKDNGDVPAGLVLKASVMMAPSNPLGLRVVESLGATTVNVPSDVSMWELAEMRAAATVPIDLYVEAPDGLGGVVRGEQLADLVAAGAPLYAKFGLRNSRPLYPHGLHLETEAVDIAREKVRRAAVGLEWLERSESPATQSVAGAAGLGIPEP